MTFSESRAREREVLRGILDKFPTEHAVRAIGID